MGVIALFNGEQIMGIVPPVLQVRFNKHSIQMTHKGVICLCNGDQILSIATRPLGTDQIQLMSGSFDFRCPCLIVEGVPLASMSQESFYFKSNWIEFTNFLLKYPDFKKV